MSGLRIRVLPLAAIAIALLLSACGGGGGGGGGSTAVASPAPPLPNFNILGGATTTSVQSNLSSALCPATPEQTSLLTAPSTTSAAVYMDMCPTQDVTGAISVVANIPYISVYVCAPGDATNCAWIDHIAVDTGSEGLRISAAAIPSTLLAALPAVTTTSLGVSGAPVGPVGECYDFVSSFFWGGVHTADVKFGGTVAPVYPNAPNTQLAASGIKVQILNDLTMPSTPPQGVNGQANTTTTCGASSAGSTQESSAAQIGANGLIGIGLFQEDCHGNCTPGGAANYFVLQGSTATGTLTPIVPSATVSVQNPVAALPAPYNMGTTFELNAVHNIISSTKTNNSLNLASAFAGRLTFGPSPSNVHQIIADPINGYIQSTVLGTNYTLANSGGSYLDSGSNAMFFSNSGTTSMGIGLNIAGVSTCPGKNVFACVTTTMTCSIDGINPKCASLSPSSMTSVATAASPAPATYTIPVDPANYPLAVFDSATTFMVTSPAVDGLALVSASNAGIFDWGLPFFFGRTLYFGIANPAVQQNPYYGLGF